MAGVLKTRFEYGDDVPAIANAAVTASRILKLAAGGKGTQGKPKVEHTGAATDYVYGAAKRDAATGETVTVVRRGTVTLLEAHGAIAENQLIMPAAAGRVQADDTTTAGRTLIGRALHAVTAQGQFVWCIVDYPIK